jgi:hypothetical protein
MPACSPEPCAKTVMGQAIRRRARAPERMRFIVISY